MMDIYQPGFYSDRHQKTIYSAERILEIVLETLPPVYSVVDVGCGVGTWLSVLRNMGVQKVKGLDGIWVDRDLLQIEESEFLQVDFETGIQINGKFDLAISLEVAEHLSPDAAEAFIKSLTDAADQVLFSAAIPQQGGTHHLNEQWPEYWAELFSRQGFAVLDVIRWQVWDDKEILPWYRQNTLLFVKRDRIERMNIPDDGFRSFSSAINVVHPETFLDKIRHISTIRSSLQNLFQGIKRKIWGGIEE